MNPMEATRHVEVELPLPRALNEPIGLGYTRLCGGSR